MNVPFKSRLPDFRSLRIRLLLYTSGASVLVLGLLCVAVYASLRQFIVADFDHELLTKARAVGATAAQHKNGITFDYAPEELPKFVTNDHPDYFQAWIGPQIVIRSPSLRFENLPRPTDEAKIVFKSIRLPDGRRGRAVNLCFYAPVEKQARGDSPHAQWAHFVLLTVATESTELDEMLGNLQWLLVIYCGLAVVLSGATLMWISERAVRPIERLARDIDRLRENDLAARLASPDAPSELQPIVDRLNGLLRRIADAFSREKAFTSDVAHELRTPLAALLTTFDVCRSRSRERGEYVAAIDKCRDVAHRMQTMIESLLIVARADAGQLALRLQPIDATELLDDSWALFAARSEERNLRLDWQVLDSLVIRTDPQKLRIIVHNLLDNACSYADDGGTIRVAARIEDGQFRLEVANTGSRVSSADARRVYDRFWRGDQARADTGVHSGLGLSLCQRLSRLLHGQIEIESSAGEWFIVRLAVPANSPDQSSPDRSSADNISAERATESSISAPLSQPAAPAPAPVPLESSPARL